jgi:hypothetical protein
MHLQVPVRVVLAVKLLTITNKVSVQWLYYEQIHLSWLLPSRRNCWSGAPPLKVHQCVALSCKLRRRASGQRPREPSGASNQRRREPSEDTEGSRRSSWTQLPDTRLEAPGICEDPIWPSEWARPGGGVEGHDPRKMGPRSPILIIRRFRERMSLVSSCFCPFQLHWLIILCWELMPSRVSCWFYCSSNRALLLYSLHQQKNATMGVCQIK